MLVGGERPPKKVFRVRSLKHTYVIVGAVVFVGMLLFLSTLLWFRRTRSVGSVSSHAVAVLPFQNVSGDPANDYLRFAIADEVATALTYAPSLEVRPGTSTGQFASSESRSAKSREGAARGDGGDGAFRATG